MIYVAIIGRVDTVQQLDKIKAIFDTSVELLYDSQTAHGVNYTMYEHITAVAIKLQNKILYNPTVWTTGISDKAILLLDDLNTDKLLNVNISNLQNDAIIFDNIKVDKDQSWMLASANAMIKTCISGKKLESYFTDPGDRIYFATTLGNMFKFIWYSYRNGIKVYCA